MTQYKNVNPFLEPMIGDIEIAENGSKCEIIGKQGNRLVIRTMNDKPFVNGKAIVERKRPVEKIKTEFEREDFHIGDKITYWY